MPSKAPESSLRPSTSFGPGFEAVVNPFPHPCFCDLMAVAIYLGCSLWDLAPAFWVMRRLKASWVWCSGMTAEQGMGN